MTTCYPARVLLVLAVFAGVAAVWPRGAGAQSSGAVAAAIDPAGAQAAAPFESFVLPDHWSRDALHRLAGLGLLEAGEVAVAWPLGRARVRALLVRAVAAAEHAGDVSAADLAAGFVRRFEREYPEPTDSRLGWGGRIDVGWAGDSGVLRGGVSTWVDDVGWVYQGPVDVAGRSSSVVLPVLDVSLGSALTVSAGYRDHGGRTRAEHLYIAAGWRGLDAWAGRRTLSFGPASAGIVLSDGVAFDGVGVELPGGAALPGPLERLGPLRGAMLVARMERSGFITRPWFWALRLALAPRPSISVGLNRAAIFGGRGNEPVTARNVALMLIGLTDTGPKSSEFENQVASVDVLWTTRARGLPLTVYGEWGIEDIGAAWRRVPGILAGVELAGLPGRPGIGAGIERASFSRSGGGNPPWYRHGPLGEGWTDRGRLLGHPLGGHGTEWTARIRYDAPRPGARLAGRIFHRDRRDENLFAPDRTGSSVGGALDVLLHGPSFLRVETGLDLESGRSGWRRWAARAVIGASF